MVLHVFLWRSAREGGGVRQRGWSSGAGAVPGCGHRGAASSAPALPQGLPWGSPTLRALGRGSGPSWVCWGGGWEAAAVLAVNRRHWDGQKAGTDGQCASITLHPHPLGPGSQGGLGAAAWAVPGTSGVPVTLLWFSETAGAERSLWVQNLGLHAGVLQNSALGGGWVLVVPRKAAQPVSVQTRLGQLALGPAGGAWPAPSPGSPRPQPRWVSAGDLSLFRTLRTGSGALGWLEHMGLGTCQCPSALQPAAPTRTRCSPSWAVPAPAGSAVDVSH